MAAYGKRIYDNIAKHTAIKAELEDTLIESLPTKNSRLPNPESIAADQYMATKHAAAAQVLHPQVHWHSTCSGQNNNNNRGSCCKHPHQLYAMLPEQEEIKQPPKIGI